MSACDQGPRPLGVLAGNWVVMSAQLDSRVEGGQSRGQAGPMGMFMEEGRGEHRLQGWVSGLKAKSTEDSD